MSNHILTSLSALALTLGLAQGMARADLTDAESELAFKALTHRVTEAQRSVGATAAARSSMQRQIRDARKHLGIIRSVEISGRETNVVGGAGHIKLTLPGFATVGRAEGGALYTSVLLPDEPGGPRRRLVSEHFIKPNGVVNRTVRVDAYTAVQADLGRLRSSRHEFPAGAPSPRSR